MPKSGRLWSSKASIAYQEALVLSTRICIQSLKSNTRFPFGGGLAVAKFQPSVSLQAFLFVYAAIYVYAHGYVSYCYCFPHTHLLNCYYNAHSNDAHNRYASANYTNIIQLVTSSLHWYQSCSSFLLFEVGTI